MSVTDGVQVLKAVYDTKVVLDENLVNFKKLTKLQYDIHNLTYDVELRVNELEKPKDGQVEKEAEAFDDFEEVKEEDDDDDFKLSANKRTLKGTWNLLHDIDDFIYDVNSTKRYEVEEKENKRQSVKMGDMDGMRDSVIGHGHFAGHESGVKTFSLGDSKTRPKLSVNMEALVEPKDDEPSTNLFSAPVDDETPLDHDVKPNPDMDFFDRTMDAAASVKVEDVSNGAGALAGQMAESVTDVGKSTGRMLGSVTAVEYSKIFWTEAGSNAAALPGAAAALPGQMFGTLIYRPVASVTPLDKITNASSDKLKIEAFLRKLEDERKAVLGVLANVEGSEAQRKIIAAIEDVQIKVSPVKMSSSSNLLQSGGINNQEVLRGPVTPADIFRQKRIEKNLLLSAVSFQMPLKKPASPGGSLGNRGLKGYIGNRINNLRGKGYKYPKGEEFVDGIYDPTTKEVASGIPTYVKRNDPKVFLVLNSTSQRWQIQDNDSNTDQISQEGGQTICYAYCNRAFAQPERCAAQPWMVLNRDGSYTLYDGNILISTTSTLAQLELVDREDKVNRLIGSHTKMSTIEEAKQALSLVAYSEANIQNVQLVVKALTCVLDVIRPDHLVTDTAQGQGPGQPPAMPLKVKEEKLRELAAEMINVEISSDDTPKPESWIPLHILLVGDGGLLPMYLEQPAVVYWVLRVIRFLCRYGVNTASETLNIRNTMELFAAQKNFLSSLVFVLNKQSNYRDVVEQAAWLIAIFSQICPKKLFSLNAVGAIIVNTEDEYDVFLDHITGSIDVACAACESLGTLVSVAGKQGILDFDKAWGEGVLNKSIKVHWTDPIAAYTCTLCLMKILPSWTILRDQKNSVSLVDQFEREGITYELIKMLQLHFWNAELVALILRLLVDFAQIPESKSLHLMAKTKGFMPLMIRVSEYYKDKPEVDKDGFSPIFRICRELYDLFFREEDPYLPKPAVLKKEMRLTMRRLTATKEDTEKGKNQMTIWHNIINPSPDSTYENYSISWVDFKNKHPRS